MSAPTTCPQCGAPFVAERKPAQRFCSRACAYQGRPRPARVERRPLPEIEAAPMCACGCGEPTRRLEAADNRAGLARGEFRRFVRNHHKRRQGPLYVEEDRGFTTPCRIFQGGISPDGYGRLWDGARIRPAHCLIYERERGPIPPGLHLDHLCRVRACVHVDHLEPVTRSVNNQRAWTARTKEATR